MVPDYEALEDQIVIGDCEIKATKNTFTTKHRLIVAKQGLKAAKTKCRRSITFFPVFNTLCKQLINGDLNARRYS